MPADTAFSLILDPDIHRDLRGEFCRRQSSNPLTYHICRQENKWSGQPIMNCLDIT